jgi:signal transduction histidine kinase/FixJ family two-component response regulator
MDVPFILVVDDEPGIALLCKRLLTRAGYAVETFTNPREAVSYLGQHPIDLLLVDIRMPEVDGFEVIEHTQCLQPDAAVLIMTGHGTVETAIRALRQGVDGLILKPFGQGSELIDTVRQAFADSQQKQDAARTKTLRPLFSVTESLLSETRLDRLPDLIVTAIRTHMRCSNAAYYQRNPATGALELLASQGTLFPEEKDSALGGPLRAADESGAPLLVNTSGPGDVKLQALLADLKLKSAILVPIIRPNFSLVLYAARSMDEPSFRVSDLEMFQILARQAAVAMENARLYAEQVDYVRKVEDSQKALLQAEKMATAGRLSASIAHEVNNPLQAVRNCLHLAGHEELPLEKRKEYFDLARTELERLMITVQRMLDFYRPGAISQEKIDLGEVLKYVVSLMTKQLSENNVKVECILPDKLPTVMAVGNQMQQIFINLILNAMDAMPYGGILKVTARSVKGGVEFIFHDNGPGVPVEKQSNIFEPFFSTKDRGTGLGLTVSYNIVTAHGGLLELLPDRKPGACFRLFLPTGGKQ